MEKFNAKKVDAKTDVVQLIFSSTVPIKGVAFPFYYCPGAQLLAKARTVKIELRVSPIKQILA